MQQRNWTEIKDYIRTPLYERLQHFPVEEIAVGMRVRSLGDDSRFPKSPGTITHVMTRPHTRWAKIPVLHLTVDWDSGSRTTTTINMMAAVEIEYFAK